MKRTIRLRLPAPLSRRRGPAARIVAMNEALLVGALRQHELTAAADSANARLRTEITAHKRAVRALHQAQGQLQDRAGQLEWLVVERTEELTVTNKRLAASVLTIGKSKEEYRLLLRESQNMQGRLSLLTRRILTTQEEERKRISRELHDDLMQTLVGINLELAVLSKGVTADPVALRAKIIHSQRRVADFVTEVHRFARELRPTELDHFGLLPALQAYVKDLAGQKHLEIQLTARGAVEALGSAERAVLFRVAQESLTNVIRHAGATLVKVGLAEIAGGIQMKISDNGRSFPVGKILRARNPKRLGLIGMKERVEMVGGSLTIESKRGQGTTVQARIPFGLVKPR